MQKHHFMKYCSTCGSKIEIESFFCSKCGNKLGELELPENEYIIVDTQAISDVLNNVEKDTKSQIQLLVKSVLVLLIGSILITTPFFFVIKNNLTIFDKKNVIRMFVRFIWL